MVEPKAVLTESWWVDLRAAGRVALWVAPWAVTWVGLRVAEKVALRVDTWEFAKADLLADGLAVSTVALWAACWAAYWAGTRVAY
jgi:hypothetical protein